MADIRNGPEGSDPRELTDVGGGWAYFTADDGVHGRELWRSDGTQWALVRDTRGGAEGSTPQGLKVVNNFLFYAANDGVSGWELWRTALVNQATISFDIDAGPGNSHPTNLTAFNNELYFSADAGQGVQLFKTNALALPGLVSPTSGVSNPQFLKVSNGKLFFAGTTGVLGTELWMSDGTDLGTVNLGDLIAGNEGSHPDNLFDINGTLFFTASHEDAGRQLFKSDGTVNGTQLVYAATKESNPHALAKVGNLLYFTADDGQHGPELWKSDGTVAGTVLVKDIYPGTDGSIPLRMTDVNGTVYFSAVSQDAQGNFLGRELWKSNGTAAGTVLVTDLRPGNGSSSPEWLTSFRGQVFFAADADGQGDKLWTSDGTVQGTVQVLDLQGGPISNPENMLAVGLRLYFVADDGLGNRVLWSTDGEGWTRKLTAAGAGTNPQYLTDVNGTLFFSAINAAGVELWKSDGTVVGTKIVLDIYPSIPNGPVEHSFPQWLASFNEKLYFSAVKDGRRELWESNGEPTGTVPLKQANGWAVDTPQWLTKVGNVLYFSAYSIVSGTELWKTDGTQMGTVQVFDIFPGDSSLPAKLIDGNGTLFFTADDGNGPGGHGRELWQSVPGGATTLVKDIRVGTEGADIDHLIVVNQRLFFTADDGYRGVELWDPPLDSSSLTPTVLSTVNPELDAHSGGIASEDIGGFSDRILLAGGSISKRQHPTVASVDPIQPRITVSALLSDLISQDLLVAIFAIPGSGETSRPLLPTIILEDQQGASLTRMLPDSSSSLSPMGMNKMPSDIFHQSQRVPEPILSSNDWKLARLSPETTDLLSESKDGSSLQPVGEPVVSAIQLARSNPEIDDRLDQETEWLSNSEISLQDESGILDPKMAMLAVLLAPWSPAVLVGFQARRDHSRLGTSSRLKST
jgi:ELWxxDGT repeat protein